MAANSSPKKNDPKKESRSAIVPVDKGYFELSREERRAFLRSLIESLNPENPTNK